MSELCPACAWHGLGSVEKIWDYILKGYRRMHRRRRSLNFTCKFL